VHPSIDRVVGDFSSVDLLEVQSGTGDTFAEAAQALQAQLWSDLDHLACSGVEVLRELGSRRGPGRGADADRVHQRHRARQPGTEFWRGRQSWSTA
jgi:pyochelin synthetase